MGKVLSLVAKPLRNFNLESRAHKIIGQEKPRPAPKYVKEQLAFEEMLKDNPNALHETQIKDDELDKFLKQVYVKSHDPVISEINNQNPDKPLPLDRNQVEDFEYGIKQPDSVPEGKVTLKNALKFITDHQTAPRLHTSEKISEDYAVPSDTIKNVLKYYKVLEIYIPEQRKVKAHFAGPSVPRIKFIPRPKKQLPAPEEKKSDT